MILALLRILFVYWWEKRVEKHLYYYQDDATEAMQFHLFRAGRGSTTRHSRHHTMKIPIGEFRISSPLRIDADMVIDGGGKSKIKHHAFTALSAHYLHNVVLQGLYTESSGGGTSMEVEISPKRHSWG